MLLSNVAQNVTQNLRRSFSMTNKPQKGDHIYIQYGSKIRLREITWIGKGYFEWNFGFSECKNIIPNTDKNSKVKWIHKHY